MHRLLHTEGRLRCKTCRWRRRLAPSLVALVLALPSAAHPCSLEQLLRLSLARLLQLEIAPRRLSSAEGHGAGRAARPGFDGGHRAV